MSGAQEWGPRETVCQPRRLRVVPANCPAFTAKPELHGGVAGGHFGEEKIMGRLQARFYWPGQWADVRNWCRTCPMCVTRKTPTPRQRGPGQDPGRCSRGLLIPLIGCRIVAILEKS